MELLLRQVSQWAWSGPATLAAMLGFMLVSRRLSTSLLPVCKPLPPYPPTRR